LSRSFFDVVGARRMTRAFRPTPIDDALLREVLLPATRAPSAGNTQALQLIVVREPSRYWAVTLPLDRRASFPWPGLLIAPVLVLVAVDPAAYVARYGEPDKARTGLGASEGAWPQPLWFVDGGMAALAILYASEAAGLGACFFGVFEHEDALRSAFGLAPSVRLLGTIALGYRDEAADRPSGSALRARRSFDAVVRFD